MGIFHTELELNSYWSIDKHELVLIFGGSFYSSMWDSKQWGGWFDFVLLSDCGRRKDNHFFWGQGLIPAYFQKCTNIFSGVEKIL